MKYELPKAFNGKLFVPENDKTVDYQFFCNEKDVNIICYDPIKLLVNIKKQKWIQGIASNNKQVVFSVGNLSLTRGDVSSVSFYSPVVIYGNTNIEGKHIITFKELYFYGDIIDAIYPPNKILSLNNDNGLTLKFKKAEDVNLQKRLLVKPNILLKATIGGPINWENTGKIYNIADTIRSKIGIEFKKPQPLDKVYDCIKVLYELFVLLTRHKNLDIVKRIVVQYKYDDKTFRTDYGIYMNNDMKENYSAKINIYNAIQIENLWHFIQNLFGLFLDNNFKPNLDFCCDNNDDLFSGIDVINICNSLNREFDILCIYFKSFNNYAVKYINKLQRKELNQTKKSNLINYIKSCSVEKLEKVYLKLKIELLFKWFLRYIKIIEKNSNRDRLPYNYKNFIKMLPKFIAIRNSAAHAFIEWNEGKHLMTHMEMIVYVSIFYRAGYDLKKIIDEISKVF